MHDAKMPLFSLSLVPLFEYDDDLDKYHKSWVVRVSQAVCLRVYPYGERFQCMFYMVDKHGDGEMICDPEAQPMGGQIAGDAMWKMEYEGLIWRFTQSGPEMRVSVYKS